MSREQTKLKKFEGKEVVESVIKVTKAGDGLSSALELDPIEIQVGERGYLILEWECTDVQHPRLKPGSKQLRRKHVLETQRAMIVDGAQVAETLDARDREIEEQDHERRVKEAEKLAEQQEQGR